MPPRKLFNQTQQVSAMAKHEPSYSNQAEHSDGCADAFAAIVIIALIVSAVAYWLRGMPM